MTDARIPLRLLIVEDCEDDFDLLLLALRGAGFEPNAVRVETITEVETALARGGWQVVFSDFDLPGFDGLRVLELVRTQDADIPFLIVSGVIDEEQAVSAMKGGAQDYLFKGNLTRLGPAVRRELAEAEDRLKRREAQAALDRDRDILRQDRIRFVDVMSHEFRTPLNIINVAAGMLDRYGERMDAAARRERTAEIQGAVTRMSRIIDKVLLTSQLELHRWELRSEAFDLSSWCGSFLENNVANRQDRGRIRVRRVKLPPKVAMDPRVIEIALQNLISNALKYSPPDSPVDLEIKGEHPSRIEFVVRDRGIGIPEAEMSRVSTSFFRASNVGDVPGTGLGLAIVKGCADLLGGTLDIESRPGSGTCVRMCLPDWLQAETRVETTEVELVER